MAPKQSMTNLHPEDEIIAVERRWVKAHQDLDLKTIEEIMSEDYIQICSDGSTAGKTETLASYMSGNRRWEVARSDEYEIRLLGDTALLIGRWTGRGVSSGQKFDYQARFLAVYRRTDGVWKLLADQSTPLASE